LLTLVKPELVLTTHGNSAEFSRDLRERGWNAWSLAGSDQMELPFRLQPVSVGTSQETEASPVVSSNAAGQGTFGLFCALGESIANATGRLRKTELLAAYFQTLTDPGALATAVRFLAGKPAQIREQQQQAMGIGWAIIRLALLEATGMNKARYKAISRSQADAGRTTYLVLEEGSTGHLALKHWTLEEVQDLFDRLRLARSPSLKAALLTHAFRSLSPMSGQYVVKILTGDTRLGLKEGLLEEAIARAFDQDPDLVRQAHMLSGDPGETVRQAQAGTLAGVQMRPFQPVRVMLASPEETASAVWERLTGSVGGSIGQTPPPDGNGGHSPLVWLEDKYDGIRAQLHVAQGRTALYSRDLRGMTTEFPELLHKALQFGSEVVLDGEIIAHAGGKRLNFFDLQKRLGRREADFFLHEEIPLQMVVFDLLWMDGRALLHEPLTERRRLLETLAFPEGFKLIKVTQANSEETIQAAFIAARARGNEGLIAKDPDSPYAAGRRGKSWLKLKTSSLSLEVVVVAAGQGHGKRSHVLSDYTFAVRDERTGDLKIIGKAYSGLTNEEIEELTAHFKEHTLSEDGRRRMVVPNVVLEIAFDSIQSSKRHDSGLSLRFPRIKAIRRDKLLEDIDSLAKAQALAGTLAAQSGSKPSRSPGWHSRT
jgi:DNA ligase-1